MLRTFPEILLDYAVDGIVQGVCVERATDGDRLLQLTRKRARHELDEVRMQAAALREQAVADGYCDGLVKAMQSLLPVLETLQQEPSALVNSGYEHVRQCIARMAGCAEMLVPQLLAVSERWLTPDGRRAATLYVPEDQLQLLQALRGASELESLRIVPARRQYVALEVGQLVYEFDLQQRLSEAAHDGLQQQIPRLQQVLAERAERYFRDMQDALVQEDQRYRFSQLRKV